ncbi:cation-translocating P-type ATPase [Spirillospora albida]|uniref:cation-translocating P-type ATPase n=1 Tax=Spirillospora albida TaxID=58123 RepID=UPI00069089E3|nr:cation-translocating P-type ATPase [Spirillospora albida]
MGLLRSALALAPRAAATAAALPAQAVRALPEALPRLQDALPDADALRGLPGLPARAELANLFGSRGQRRVWARHGRAYIEVKGLAARSDTTAQTAVAAAVRRLDGVNWAEVNAVTGEILTAFDESRISVERLVETIEAVEETRETGGLAGTAEPFPGHGHPADRAPITAESIALAADCTAFALAVAGRVARWPKLPRGTRAAVALVDAQPRLRRVLAARLGGHGADLMLAMANAAMHGMTQEPGTLAVDALYRGVLLAELAERRSVWNRREQDLCSGGLPTEAAPRGPRPCPLPPGPVETYCERSAPAAFAGAAGMLALSRSPRMAADILLAAVPKAARVGREGFAATLGRDLGRRGVVPLQGSAYRRLDRITAVVLDSAVLCGDGLQILDADEPGAWRTAARLLAADPGLTERPDAEGRRLRRTDPGSPDDPAGLRMELADAAGTVLGRVRVGCRVDPLADAVLGAARESGVRVLLTEHAATAELISLADDALGPELPLSEHILALQGAGEAVLLATTADTEAALAADVGVAVLGHGPSACWGADLVCGPGLGHLWRILGALGPAREASRRSVRMALGGTSLGALLVVNGRRGTAPYTLAPVHSAALIALVTGVVSARRLAARRDPAPAPRVAWHAMDPDTALDRAAALRTGEPEAPAARRPPPGPIRVLADVGAAVGHELRDPLTPVLVLGAAASAIVGSGVDAALVGGVTAGNAAISGVQRMRAERALRTLLLGQRPPARRLRDGVPPPEPSEGGLNGSTGADDEIWETVLAADLRPGDVIALRPSDVVPADARLLEAADLEVDEASLTGESLPVAKSVDATPGADLADRTCMVFEDTTVLAGQAHAVVVATGAATQAGRAAALAGKAPPPSGVQVRLNELTRVAMPVTGLSGALVTALAFARGVSIRQAVSSGVSVAVAAVPEGLPLVATVAQLAAARRLSRRNILVRSSRTLGTMGQVDTLCFDKTGTLTEGRLGVARLSGPKTEVAADSPAGRRLLTAGARACPQVDEAADLRHATDRAVLTAARETAGDDADWTLLHETPFEPSRGFAAAVGTAGDRPCLAVKGAPEVVLERCTRVVSGNGTRPLTDAGRRDARRTLRRLAEDGLRVLAVAEASPSRDDIADGDRLGDLVESAELALTGFIGIADAPRPAAAGAIDRLTRAGIRVAMITGDHPATAQAIAADLGIPAPDRVLTGAELDRLPDAERTARIAETSVFARVGPEHKVRIVQSLQRAGRTVAMTGDGANDAAAIRLADVGIGLTAGDSRAAQSAADLVLRGGDLPAIVEALLEGRALWDSVRNAVSILVGGNAGEIAFTVYGTALGGRSPLTTRQLLLVNTLTDMMPALAVALAPPGGDREDGTGPSGGATVRRGPLADPLHEAIAVRGAVTAMGAVLAWHAGRFTGRGRRAATMGLAALVLTQLLQTLQAGWRSPAVLVTCGASTLLLAAVIETPGVSRFFGCTPLGPAAWAMVLSAAAGAAAASFAVPRALRALSLVREEPTAPTA